MTFDPSEVAIKNGNFFGFPYSIQESNILLLSVPWDVTTSYRDGTSNGPQAILGASYQLDFFSPYKENAWETKLATIPFRSDWLALNSTMRMLAKELIEFQEKGGDIHSPGRESDLLRKVNHASAEFHLQVQEEVEAALHHGKVVLTIGGDHSISYGPIRAYAKKYADLSILHLDAHADLRVAYEGFHHSHASIMHLVAQFPEVTSLVQVGLRDVSPQEIALIATAEKIHSFFDWQLHQARSSGISWKEQCAAIIEKLGKHVYVSFDIDGLDPRFCPNTGTPVPGGLDFNDALYLFQQVIESGRKIVGADLVEVAPGKDEWDANVGARIAYQLCQFMSLN